MKRFTDAGRAAIAAGNLYAGLSLALTLPDICASLEDPGTGKSKARFVRWAAQWLEPVFTHEIGADRRLVTFITANELYQLRCSLIHSGSAEIDGASGVILERIVFSDDSSLSHLNRYTRTLTDGRKVSALQVRASNFSHDIYDAADRWDTAQEKNGDVQLEKARLLQIHSSQFIDFALMHV